MLAYSKKKLYFFPSHSRMDSYLLLDCDCCCFPKMKCATWLNTLYYFNILIITFLFFTVTPEIPQCSLVIFHVNCNSHTIHNKQLMDNLNCRLKKINLFRLFPFQLVCIKSNFQTSKQTLKKLTFRKIIWYMHQFKMLRVRFVYSICGE